MTPQSALSLSENQLEGARAQGGRHVPLQIEVPGKPAGQRSNEKDMIGFFHDETGCGDGMKHTFQGRDRACSKIVSFHDRCVHPLDPIQLTFRATACIE
jgi:hypothetical protein